jgi:xanthine dehydrogenase accessory factor
LKELRDILDAAEKATKNGDDAALITIVKAKGSTYRRAGARMLMTLKGEMVGSISGGCLEGDVFEHAKKVMQTGNPVVIDYDTSSDDDTVWGLGLGCSGVVHVLIESLKHLKLDYLRFLEARVAEQSAGALATVFRVEGQIESSIGSRLTLQEDGSSENSISNLELRTAVAKDAREAIVSGRSSGKEYKLASGTAEVFIEAIQPAIPLVLFGAGHDAIPVSRLAKELGWNVTVVDSREAFISKQRFPEADRLILSDSEDLRSVPINHWSVAVIMTHNYIHDLNILRQLMPIETRYLGVLGPKRRTQKLLDDLGKEGMTISEQQLTALFSPAGLDIGAETPEEIALAIIGEIQAALTGRSAGMLRNRKGPIHDSNS